MENLRKSRSLPYLFYWNKKADGNKKVEAVSRKNNDKKNECDVNKPSEETTIQVISKVNSTSEKYQRANHFQSCVNLFAMRSKHNYQSDCPKLESITRPKSLCDFSDDLIPLLEKTSSISSIGSINNITEESVLETSLESLFDKSQSELNTQINSNNPVKQRNRKLQNYKHRPRSIAGWPENGLCSITENLKLRKNLFDENILNQSKGLECDGNVFSSLENSLNIEKGKLETTINTENSSKESIIIPRRKTKTNITMETLRISASVNEKSFTKEQRRRLKQKMRDTHKSPENSVFLGLF